MQFIKKATVYRKRRVFDMKQGKKIVAKILKGIARKSVNSGLDSRCMFLYHQPKMPSGIKKI